MESGLFRNVVITFLIPVISFLRLNEKSQRWTVVSGHWCQVNS